MALIQNITRGATKTSIFIHSSKEKVDKEEMQIMEKICQCIDEGVKKEFLDLLKEYQAQQTLEAKLVKELNGFEYLLQHHEKEDKSYKPPLLSTLNLIFGFENKIMSSLEEELQKKT